jgi:hypothetical protein
VFHLYMDLNVNGYALFNGEEHHQHLAAGAESEISTEKLLMEYTIANLNAAYTYENNNNNSALLENIVIYYKALELLIRCINDCQI